MQTDSPREKKFSFPNLLQRHIALPAEHGAWVFLLSPLLIGTAIGKSFHLAGLLIWVASISAFLLRQPVSIVVKVYSGRRHRRDLIPAYFWIAVYSLCGLLSAMGLISLGYSYLFILLLPASLVFAWHLWLVYKRAERRQIGVEIVASGTLALAAPAMVWTGAGQVNRVGWVLFFLTWLQSAASIVYAYLRLQQRTYQSTISLQQRLSIGKRALLYSSANVVFAATFAILHLAPSLWITIPFFIQWLESLYGVLRPAIGAKPTSIGIRQLIISIIFTLAFILVWR